MHLKIRRRDGVESLTILEEGEFKLAIDGCINEITNDIPKCNYLTPGEFSQTFSNEDNQTFSILNANIRSINKNFDKLKECIKSTNHPFTIIGLSETHLKEPPSDY